MAFALNHNGKWSADFTDASGARQRRIVGDGSSATTAKAEAKLIAAQLRKLRADRRSPNLAGTDFFVDEWQKEIHSTLSSRNVTRVVGRKTVFNELTGTPHARCR